MAELDGVRWGPASKATPRQLVVLCHGLGADAHDLIDLAPSWSHAVPDALFVSVDAPETARFRFRPAMVGRGRPRSGADGGRRAARRSGAGRVRAGGDGAGWPARRTRIALMGFSQGAMTVLFSGLRMTPAPRAILAFSGALIAPDKLAAEMANRAPVLLVHGEADDVVPAHRSHDAEAALRAAGVPVEAAYVPRLGHGIDETGIALGALALQRAFAEP